MLTWKGFYSPDVLFFRTYVETHTDRKKDGDDTIPNPGSPAKIVLSNSDRLARDEREMCKDAFPEGMFLGRHTGRNLLMHLSMVYSGEVL